MTTSKRLLSLDVMRGITIAGMILVNDPGSWKYVYAPLKHVHWDGLTPTDLVFPFFMFIMGISMYFSLGKYQYTLTSASLGKILKRTVMIFLVGLGLNLFSHLFSCGFAHFENLRILGVMQRLALAYGIGSVLGLVVNRRFLLPLAFLILAGYGILLSATDSLVLSEQNIVGVIDRALLGETHVYIQRLADGTIIRLGPEGVLSTLGSVGRVLLGFYVGRTILENKNDTNRIVQQLFVFGTLLLFVGFLLSYGWPVNKKLWSPAFVLVSSGFGSLLLALLMWNIDINSHQRWCRFFEVFGINPLYLYVQAALLAILLGKTGVQAYVYDQWLAPVLGNYPASLAWAILFVLLNWLPGYVLYKKRIYIKL
ncbi:MAG: heparan-alpha-glucosaminide N-acetyltransferase domain-containing protein [Tannerellaceae bacterium]|nr:heparan-alpha-glucosaminide N-acetyltransferase domain-containing protein [Tannerellaceae bacterium]